MGDVFAADLEDRQARWKFASLPPAMIVSVAASAPTWPPETGASTQFTRSAHFFVSGTPVVPKSMMSASGCRPSIKPPGPKTTFSTTSVIVRLMQMTPGPISRARSGSVAARFMPRATAASAGASLRFQTTTSAPASCK
jgi:hypothetical protein